MWLPAPDMRAFLLILLFGLSMSCLAQSTTVLGVKELLEQEEYDRVVSLTGKLLETSTDPLQRARLLQLQADALYYINKLPESLQSYLAAIEAASKSEVKDLFLLLECHGNAGFCYSELGIHKKALNHYFQALDYSVSYKDSVQLAMAYYNVGVGYQKLGDYANAIDYANRAYAIDLARKDTFALAFDLNQMGYLSEQNGNYSGAIQRFKESILLHEKGGGNINSIAVRLNSIGMAFQKLGMLDSAEFYVGQSLQAHQQTSDSINIAERWINLASIYNRTKKYGEARQLLSQAMAYYERLDEGEQLSSARLTLAENCLLTGQFNQAEQLLFMNINYSRQNELLTQLKDSYQVLARVKEYQGRYMEALDSYKKYKLLEDSLLNIYNRNAISELNIKYEVDHKDQENEILRLENEVQQSKIDQQEARERWLVFSLAGAIISLMAITLALTSRYRAKRLQLEAEVNEMRTKISVALQQDTNALALELEELNKRLAQPLSEREFEILTHALSNLNNSEIADKVFVSVNTVKFHLKNIYDKLGVANRKEALQFALNPTNDQQSK